MRNNTNKKHNYKDLSSVLSYDESTGIITWSVTIPKSLVSNGTKAGYIHHTGYRVISYQKRKYLAHRVAWLLHKKEWPRFVIDHINGKKDDNRICNLRDVPISQNNENQRAAQVKNKSGYFGVVCRGNKWVSTINHRNKQIYLGTFENPESAHRAYVEAKRKIHKGATL